MKPDVASAGDETSQDPAALAPVLNLADAAALCSRWHAAGERVVLTNGCFDLLHAGHVSYLGAARRLGDRLVVALDEDASVRRLKGAGRPLNPLSDRARVMAALRMVDLVTSFPGPTAVAVVEALRPAIYVKGGDYDDGASQPPEAATARRLGAQVRYLPFLSGRSTTDLIERARSAGGIDFGGTVGASGIEASSESEPGRE
jgi:rfaE bifunctional protein nucleotidyltransferase chain/domain